MILGTQQGRIMVCEVGLAIKENIWDVLGDMKKSVFFWDQFSIGLVANASPYQGRLEGDTPGVEETEEEKVGRMLKELEKER